MNTADTLMLLANLEILTTGILLYAFIIGYGIFFQWRKTAVGRSVMYFVGSLALLVSLAALLQWAPNLFQEETKQFLRFEVYTTIMLAAGRMVFVLRQRWKTTGKLLEGSVERRKWGKHDDVEGQPGEADLDV